MTNPSEYVDYYLHRMRDGDWEGAFFSIIEADETVVPLLIRAFQDHENRGIRAGIARCIWQHRRREDVGFLTKLLYDSEEPFGKRQ